MCIRDSLPTKLVRLACNRGDPPSHWCPQQRLTIHMYETLCSPETRPRRHRTSVSSGAAACVFLGGMTLPCRGCATDKRLRVSRPAHCHRHERESHRRPPSAKALQRPIEPPVRPTASPKPASRTGKAHWFLSDPTASSRHCCQARWCWFPSRFHTPTPGIPAGQRASSPASTVVQTPV